MKNKLFLCAIAAALIATGFTSCVKNEDVKPDTSLNPQYQDQHLQSNYFPTDFDNGEDSTHVK